MIHGLDEMLQAEENAVNLLKKATAFIQCFKKGNPRKHPDACELHCKCKCDNYWAYKEKEFKRLEGLIGQENPKEPQKLKRTK